MPAKRKKKSQKSAKKYPLLLAAVGALLAAMVGANLILHQQPKEATPPRQTTTTPPPVPAVAEVEPPEIPQEPDDKPDDEPDVVEPPATPAPVATPAPAPAAAGAKAGGNELLHWLKRSNAIYSLHEAAEAGDLQTVQARLAEEADLEQRDEQGRTPLYIAAQHKQQEVVDLLLDKGADLCAADAAGKCPAHFYTEKPLPVSVEKALRLVDCCRVAVEAIAQGDVAKLEACFAQGLNPNARYDSHYLLQYAVARRDTRLVMAVLKAGASPNIRYPDGKTPLHIIAGDGAVETAKVLVQHGADPMIKAGNGAFPLHEAVWYNKADMVDYLLPLYKRDNFNPAASCGFPVKMAIQRRNNQALELFILHGLNVNDERFAANPLLTCAVRHNNPEAVSLLLRAGAAKSARDQNGRRAVDYANDSIKPLLK